MKKVILLSGKAQSGKDSTANILVEKLPNAIILHFADVLKFYAKQYFGWNGEKFGPQRDLLQWLGTNRVRKEMGWATYWAERVCDVIEILEDKFDYFIVADCRFPNEISYPKERLEDFDIISVRVIRKDFDNGLSEEQQNHESEVALDCCEFDYVIESESGLDNLNYAILDFLRELEKRNE
jgi:hypothetical protein